MNEFGLSIGSNIGDKKASVRCAIEGLRGLSKIQLAAVSSLFRTTPWGKTDQEWFVNACVIGSTELAPDGLLRCCQQLEKQQGRTRKIRWGPRTIDIDILFFGDLTMKTFELTLPHPELFNRAFVLVPLASIAGLDRVIGGRSLEQAMAALRRFDGDVVCMD
jgi:2-amino-4-hydroxy-6-hydroxymethyldihydropteridine diphosphokinase